MARFTTAGREGFIRLKPGRYYWKVTDAETAWSQRTGAEQIKLTLQVGDKNGTMRILETLTFSEKALFRIEHFLKSAGVYPGDDVDLDVRPEECIGLSGWCETIDEAQDNGKVYAKIDVWLPREKQDASRFAAVERAAIASSRSQKRDVDEWDGDIGPMGDDIPF